MVGTRSSPKKVSKASKISRGFKSTPHKAAKSPVGITKPRRATKPTPKARRTQQGRFLPARSSPDTLNADEVPETDLDIPDDLYPAIVELKHRLAKLEGGRNAHLKDHRIIDVPRRPRRQVRHSSDLESISEVEVKEEDTNRVSFIHSEGTRPFVVLYSRYHSVNIKYFKQILHETFHAENLTKLGHGLTNRGASDAP